jgi:magnesium chelatase accessory protein
MQTESIDHALGLEARVLSLTKPWTLRLSCWIRPATAGGPTWLLLHGTGSDHASFHPLCAKLPDHIGLIIPDLPGHGASGLGARLDGLDSGQTPVPPPFGLREVAQWLEDALHQVGISPSLLIGHSAGGAIGMAMALAHPDRVVLGLAPSLVPPPQLYNTLVGPWLGPVVRSRPSLALGHWLACQKTVIDHLLASTASPIDPAQRARYRALFQSRQHLAGTLAFMAGTDLPDLLADPRLRAIRQVGILSARDDPWIPASALDKVLKHHLPTADARWLNRGGHLFHETDVTPVVDFIAELTNP